MSCVDKRTLPLYDEVVASLTFYGGVNEIGGNKILLEDGDTCLFLDFGTPFAQRSRFFEEFLKPRVSAGLLDLLAMGLLPPLLNIYRDDLAPPALWTYLQSSPLHREWVCKELSLAGVLLSHAHLDHSGYISFLQEGIPIYATAMTAVIAKAMQDSSPIDFEKEVCYCIPKEREDGLIKSTDYRRARARQRDFRIMDAANLSSGVREFWREVAGGRGLQDRPLGTAGKIGSLNLRYFPVDHSIFGATAFAVETSSGWVVYTGDLRLHGRRGYLTEEFAQKAAQLKPVVLLCEGTNITSSVSVREEEVYLKAREAVRAAKSLVIADFGPRNIERLLTFRQIAEETSRYLVLMSKDAYLLKSMRYVSSEIPDITSDKITLLYADAKGQLSKWEKHIRDEYQGKLITPEEVRTTQESCILCFSFFDINDLPTLMPREGSLYLYSSSEVYNEESALDMKRLHNWLDYFGITRVGLPRESLGGWRIPEGEQGFHASGHASGPELLSLIRNISPKILVPIHTEGPSYFEENLKGMGIEVRQPQRGKESRF